MDVRRNEQNEEMARLGRTLVGQLFVLCKTSCNYSEGHAAIDGPLQNLLRVVREIQRRNEEVSLRIKGDHLYLGEIRFRPDSSGFEAFRFVSREMKRHHIGRLSFGAGVTGEDLRRFVYALREVDDGQQPDRFARILERMQRRMIGNIEVETLAVEPEGVVIDRERLRDGKVKARVLYRKGLKVMEEVMVDAGVGQNLRLRESKRVVQQIIDLLSTEEAYLIGLTTMRCRDAYTQNHAVNVCILSLAMGRRLGMSKFHLCELGMAALFHDIGKAEIPREILDKPGELTAEEARLMEAHPLHGVKKMMKLKALDALSSRIVTAVFEHHLLADFSGYPRLPYRRLGLFGRIIGIADGYDALTSSRVTGRTPYPPDRALRFMLAQGGKAYDQSLLKLFINCVGVHCIGTLLLLNSKELAVVVGNHPEPGRWNTPKVRVVADSQGREIGEETVLDLAKEAPYRSIAATVDPNPYRLDVSRYFS
jgi:HD-GYP domain-containing protein (c-di-GMP phosphodiesterase class II)